MKNAFNKIPPRPRFEFGGTPLSEIEVPFTKDVILSKGSEPTKVVRFEKIPSCLLSERADIPNSENYRLKEMLEQGYVPNEVNLKGLFDSSDPLADDNINIIDKANELFNETKE